jgi:hypothetical protein
MSFGLMFSAFSKWDNIVGVADAVVAACNTFLHASFEPLVQCITNKVLQIATAHDRCLESSGVFCCEVRITNVRRADDSIDPREVRVLVFGMAKFINEDVDFIRDHL